MNKFLTWAFTHRNPAKLLILILCIFILTMVSTSFYSTPPVTPTDTVVFVNQSKYGPIVMEVRKYIGVGDGETISVSKYFYKEDNKAVFFQVESGSFKQLKGEFPVVTSTFLPKWVSGRWCVSTELTWWPSLSQREFSMETKDVCFETINYE